MKFKVGDKVRGMSDSYIITDKNMSLGEVVHVNQFGIEIKIIEHSDSSQVGKVHFAALPKGQFELVEEKEMDKIDELEMKIKELSEEIERLKAEKENEPWKPKDGDKYWLITNNGYVTQVRWLGDDLEDDIYAIGNVFRTKEEAEFRVEQLKVETELRRFARPFRVGEDNYTFYLSHRTNSICMLYSTYVQHGDIYFPSEEIARKAIDTVGEERIKKYYFGINE